MDNYLLYWIMEYIKVFLSYGFVLLVYPSILFRKFLKGKSITFRFGFCTTCQVILISTMVLMLGLLHVLNRVTMLIVFWGILIWSVRDILKPSEDTYRKLKYLFRGTFGWKHFLRSLMNSLKNIINKLWKVFWSVYSKHCLEYTLLLITVVYGMIYFSWGIFHEFSYGFGDMYVHHSWIKGLMEGQIFSDGVYPEAMHCVIYSLYALFGVDVYSGTLYLPVIHLAITFVAEYCFFKEVFHWRYCSIFTLIFFLTLDVVCINEVFSMSRLQWALPQEYGFYSMYICVIFLLRYLKCEKHVLFKGKLTKACWDENLLVFVLALAASIAIHFYSTIMAFLICVGFAIFYLKSIFNKKHFGPLVAAVICALLIAIIPMIGALASGIPFQKSIDWAVNIMNGIDPEQGYTSIAGDDEEPEVEKPQIDASTEEKVDVSDSTVGENIVTPQPVVKVSFKEKLQQIAGAIVYKIKEKWDIIYHRSYVTLYQTERTNWILAFTCLPIVLGLIYKIGTVIFKYVFHKKNVRGGYFAGYLSLVVASFLFMVFYSAAYLGLPGLVAGARLCSTGQLLILSVIMIPIDIIFDLVGRFLPAKWMQGLSLTGAVGLVAFVWFTDNFHGYLYYELSRYSASVKVTKTIMDELPKDTYTIVSPTDEIYQVIEEGRHEELLTFLEANEKEERYTIPTEYVFFYVEKKPIYYAHNHFFSGPDWVALETYDDIYAAFSPSVWPEVTASEISEQMAELNIMRYGKPSDSYSEIISRVILESKMYEWCERFKELYPNELKTYYEDDNFVCYYIRQNTQHLYDLVIE